jgi:hypothetical protein
MGTMRRKAAVCQKAKGKTPGFKPTSCEIVIASTFKDWQVTSAGQVRPSNLLFHALKSADHGHKCHSRTENQQRRQLASGLEEAHSSR